ncbi:zinc finger protein 836-like isoform X1 [Stomoxys calcitrans]|nr:zinc finger protein 836-like isoform X1 [Stomoxys calcitrans]
MCHETKFNIQCLFEVHTAVSYKHNFVNKLTEPTTSYKAMDYNLDLRNCGKILRTPTQYLLRCGDCNEDFYIFGDFITHHSKLHCLQDKDVDSPDEDDAEDYLDECEIEYCSELNDIPEHDADEMIGTQSRHRMKQQCTKDIFQEIADGESIHDEEFVNIEPMPFMEDEKAKENDSAEYFESDEDGFKDEDIKCRKFVSEFLDSEENYLAFIDAYENQPRLWNYKLYPVLCTKQDRAVYFAEIAEEIHNRLNIQMSEDYVRAIIYRIRTKYREKSKKLADRKEREGGSPKLATVPTWYFQKLQFLEPFLSKESIFKLDPKLPNMTQEQVIELIHMYEMFPNLWNTNLLENVCKNKRDESLKQLAAVIHSETGLEVSEFSLQRYLNELQKCFYNEKAKMLRRKVDSQINSSIYYKEMFFLYDHVGPFKCPQCPSKYRGPLLLKVHKTQKHNGDRLSCPQCGKQYEQLEPYITHARRHMNDLNVECPQCDKMFLRKADMRIHLRTHTGDRPYSCEICGATFSNPTAIREHRERHIKEIKFHCPVCFKGFYSKKNLKKHSISHTDVRNYPCKICGKSFKTRKTMKNHETTHEEGRNYPCPMCGNMYKNTIGVSQHMRTAHRDVAGTKFNPFID